MKSIRLIRGPHRFEVRYEPGCESRVLDQLVEWVNDRKVPFDWFDAAILSQQVGQELVKELGAYLPKGGKGIKA